jgi:phosphomannomutase/phosphoglucomutase
MSEKEITVLSNKTNFGNKKNTLSMRNILISVVLVLFAGVFFIQISTAWEKSLVKLRHTQKLQAEQVMSKLVMHANTEMTRINKIIDDTLQQQDYFEDFDKKYWQEIFKTELSSRLEKNVEIQAFPVDYHADDIIDNPDQGYAILSLLNDMKQKGRVDAEVNRYAGSQNKIILARQVKDFNQDGEDTIFGFVVLSLTLDLLDNLVTPFKPEQGYFEILQINVGKPQLLLSRGDKTLKASDLSIYRKISTSRWLYKFWPAPQNKETSLVTYWQPVIYAILGLLSLITAMVLMYITIKKHREAQYVTIPERQKSVFSKKDVKNQQTDSDEAATSDDDSAEKEVNNDFIRETLDKIFRAYDIRGVVGEQVNAQVFKRIAKGIAQDALEQQQDTIAVACDGRNSSPELIEALIEGLSQSGINVLDIGMVPTPVLYYAAISKCNGNGVMITASHNPGNYNGMKIMLAGITYSGEELEGLKKKIISDKESNQAVEEPPGTVSKLNILEDYVTKITANIILARSMNIVIDTGNGVVGVIAQTLFEQLGCKVVHLFAEVDGDFPNHPPDPSQPENMTALSNAVIKQKADIGIAFDGDGDRLGIVASGGEIIWPDRILMFLAKDVLSRNKDSLVLYDVKSTKKLPRYISQHGGKSLMCPSGHSLMRKKLLETGALLGGEMSGHIFIKERWFGFDDALFAAARVLEILSIDLRRSRQVLAEIPDSLNTPEILIPVDEPHIIIDRLLTDTSAFDDAKLITIDGLRAEFSNGWGLVRASNTTENLTIRFEADDEQALQSIAQTFKNAVLKVAPEVEFPF